MDIRAIVRSILGVVIVGTFAAVVLRVIWVATAERVEEKVVIMVLTAIFGAVSAATGFYYGDMAGRAAAKENDDA